MKKLLNKRGSVLFLVVVVMAVLLVAASATYYVVRNQHSSANVHYNSEQSYQTASSISDTVGRYLVNEQTKISKNPEAYGSSIFAKMMGMNKGEVRGGFENDISDLGMGKYKITIERTEKSQDADGGQMGVFKITTNAEVQGETAALSQMWKIKLSPSESSYFDRFLVSTGYRNEDSYIKANNLYGDTYFENPYTRTGTTNLQQSVYCAGTLVDGGMQFTNEGIVSAEKLKELEMVVADNYYIEAPDGGIMEIGGLFVGGDLTISNEGKQLEIDNVYVLGDFESNFGAHSGNIFVKGDCYINTNLQNAKGVTFYVGGDLYISKDGGGIVFLNHTTFYVEGNVYFRGGGGANEEEHTRPQIIKCRKSVEDSFSTSSTSVFDEKEMIEGNASFSLETIMSAASGEEFADWDSLQSYIDNKTGRGSYANWNAETYFKDNFADSDTIMLSDYDRSQEQGDIYIDASEYDRTHPLPDYPQWIWPEDAEEGHFEAKMAQYEAELAQWEADREAWIQAEKAKILAGRGAGRPEVQKRGEYYDDYFITISESCTFQPAKDWTGNGKYYILIDATEEDIYIKLDPGTNDLFSFGIIGSNTPCSNVWVLVKGSHSVIFIVPDGVDFKLGFNCYIGHLDLALALSGYSSAEEMYNAYGLDGKQGINVASYFDFDTKPENKTLLQDIIKEINAKEYDPITNTYVDVIDPETNQPKKVLTFDTTHPKLSGLAPHNNIFFVSTGKTNRLDFGSGAIAGNSPFIGYIYAPTSAVDIDHDESCLALLGGLIAGTYSFSCYNASLIFSEPYEPNGRGTDIVAQLMATANGGGGGSSGGSGDSQKFSAQFLGYQ